MLEEEKKEELLALLTGKKYRELKSQLVEMNEVDIASFIEELDSEKTVVVFRMLPERAGIGGICLSGSRTAAAHHYQYYG